MALRHLPCRSRLVTSKACRSADRSGNGSCLGLRTYSGGSIVMRYHTRDSSFFAVVAALVVLSSVLASAPKSSAIPAFSRKYQTSCTTCHNNYPELDRKSTRLNSSHQIISYAVFCLKKKKKKMLY